MSPVLEARGLLFGHRGRPLGRALDLEVAAGEVLCLLGPNGCGKTTLFRTLLGLLPALGGEVQLAGLHVGTAARRELARCVAYVPQAHAGVFAYTAQDVVLMGRAAHMGAFSVPSRHDREQAADALHRLGVAHLRTQRYTEISGGERQLVLIARALAQQAPLLVMDEPTASLDFGNQVRVPRQIEQLRAQGMAVCLSTHQPEHALRVADRVALMQAGSLRALGAPRDVVTTDALCELYGLQADEIPATLVSSPAAG
jgi:iron complex transport system ATP-binding protein